MNPNLCEDCASFDWEKEKFCLDTAPAPVLPARAAPPSELDHLVDSDTPGVIECLEEELAAKKAISEALALEIEEMKKALAQAARSAAAP